MSRQWFIHDGTAQKGPFSESTVSEMAANGLIGERTQVWSEGMAEWMSFLDSPFARSASVPRPPRVPQSLTSQQATTTAAVPADTVKRTPVILTILFTVITAGIYYPAWFLSRRHAINALHSKEQLGAGVFIFGIVVFSLSLLLMMASGVFEGLYETLHDAEYLAISKGIEATDKMLSAVIGITLLVQCYKVRRILREHFNAHLGHNVYWSGVMIFFFQIFYLQYKVNRLEYGKAPTTA